jgi:hypothetical protein
VPALWQFSVGLRFNCAAVRIGPLEDDARRRSVASGIVGTETAIILLPVVIEQFIAGVS